MSEYVLPFWQLKDFVERSTRTDFFSLEEKHCFPVSMFVNYFSHQTANPNEKNGLNSLVLCHHSVSHFVDLLDSFFLHVFFPNVGLKVLYGSVLRWEAKVATQLRQKPKMDPARKINLKKRLDTLINSFNRIKFRLSQGKDFSNATIMSVDSCLLKLLDTA